MEHRVLGKTGMEVSVLGFGGAQIGFEKPDKAAVAKLLNAALDAGLNALDTAECYWGGTEETSSEYLIGETISHRRDEFYLFTKCGHAAGIDAPDWSPELLTQSIERSLKRLKTDCLDLVQLHSCGQDILEKGDVITVLQEARDAGKTRYIGYSGDNADAEYAVSTGAFDALQTSISIADQGGIDRAVLLAAERDMGIIAKRPIANAVWRWKKRDDLPEWHRPYWDRLDKLGYSFLKGDAVTEYALRFTLSVPGVDTAIVGTANPQRWAENAALLREGSTLPAEEYEAMRKRWNKVAKSDWTAQT